MPGHFTQDQIKQVVHLHEVEGLTHREIAVRMGRLNKKGDPNERAIMEQYSKFKRKQSLGLIAEEVVPMPEGDSPPLLPSNVKLEPKEGSTKIQRFVGNSEIVMVPRDKTYHATPLELENEDINLSEMSKNQRYDTMKRVLKTNARGRHTFGKILDPEECDLFCQEYFRILREQDSLTNVEEQQLFTAVLNYILYHRALALDAKSRTDKDAGRISVYDTQWRKEYDDRYKQYQQGLEALKLSRNQRLKDMARSGNTFLDFAEILSKHENQEALANEIMEIEYKSEEELKRLQENGWLIFGGSKNNNPVVNYGDVNITQ